MNIEHTESLNSISKLKNLGFEGSDVNIAISLYEYSIVWKKISHNEWLFVYAIGYNGDEYNNFDRAILNECDLKNEFDWIKPANWQSFLNCLGTTWDEWNEMSFGHKIADLSGYFGWENVFGSSYWEGFKIKDN